MDIKGETITIHQFSFVYLVVMNENAKQYFESYNKLHKIKKTQNKVKTSTNYIYWFASIDVI